MSSRPPIILDIGFCAAAISPKVPGITPNHAYAVLGYDAGTDNIRCWNPHGDTTKIKGEPGPENGYPLTDGICELPLPVFVKEFSGLAFELPPHKGGEDSKAGL